MKITHLTIAALLCATLPACMAGDTWTPVPPDALEQARGGFTTPTGLSLSVGVERLVSINGEVVARNSVAFSGSGEGVRTIDAPGTGHTQLPVVIQNGMGNRLDAALDAAPGAIVIQNSLNDQAIRSETVVSASVNSLSLIKSMNFGESVGQALAGALPRQ